MNRFLRHFGKKLTSFTGRRKSPTAAAVFNLSGIGAGYIYLGAYKRFSVVAALSILLLFTGAFVHMIGSSALWLTTLIAWIAGMAYDGWRIARRRNIQRKSKGGSHEWAHVVAAFLLLVTLVASYSIYLEKGSVAVANIEKLRKDKDCNGVLDSYSNFDHLYEWTFDHRRASAERSYRECSQLLAAKLLRDRANFPQAASAYREFIRMYPRSDLTPIAAEGAALAEVRVGDEMRGRAGGARLAFEKYLAVLQEFPASNVAKEARHKMTQVYTNEVLPYFEERYCDAIEPVEYYAALRASGVEDISTNARSIRPWTFYGCAVERFDSKDTPAAKAALEKLEVLYPDSHLTALAKFVFSGRMEEASKELLVCEAAALAALCICAFRRNARCAGTALKRGKECVQAKFVVDTVRDIRDCLPTFDGDRCRKGALEVLGDLASLELPTKLLS